MKSLLVISLLASPVFGAVTERPVAAPVPDYEVRRTSGRITIDGRLDEPAWKAAAVVTLMFPWDTQTGPKQLTKVRLLWDDDYLYVAYECADTDIVAHHTRHDDPTYEDDAVELFLNPNPSRDTYVGMEMNARAVLYDYLNRFPNGLEKSYDLKGVLLAVQIDGTLNDSSDQDKGWVLEVAIPLGNFTALMNGRTVRAGTIWTANCNRWDGTEPHRRLSMWSDSGLVRADPHNPRRFGRLHFVQ